MNLVLLGPPNAGKGTQAKGLCDRFHMTQLSTGGIFRESMANKTPLGETVRPYVESGKLVPDEHVIGLVNEYLTNNGLEKGYLFDGYPRNVAQADALKKLLEDAGHPLDSVVLIQVPEEILIRRAIGRRVCLNCGATYHIEFHPPQKEGVCDVCGGEVIQRKDDQEETVRHRLEVYEEQTRPLVDYYQDTGLLLTVDGDGKPEEVFRRILEQMGEKA